MPNEQSGAPAVSPETSSVITKTKSTQSSSNASLDTCYEQHRLRLDAQRRGPPFLPPFLMFPRPFNWMFYAIMPVFMPIFMFGVVIVFILDSGRSRQRAKALIANHPLPTQSVTSKIQDRMVYTTSRQGSCPHPAYDLEASIGGLDHMGQRDIRLELTDVQRRIIRNLNEGIDQTRWKKWLTWLPTVRNAHAAIVVR
jgi:hypothetical protein